MKGFAKYFFMVWVTGLGVMFVFALNTGSQDLQAERERSLNRVGKLSTSLRLSFENLTEKTANELTRIIEVELVSKGLTHWLSDSPFQSIALVGHSSGQWAVEWAKSKTPGDAYVKYRYQTWLPKLPLGAIKGEKLVWTHVEAADDKKSKVLLLGVQLRVKGQAGETYKYAFGHLPLNYLTSLTDPLNTEEDEVFIVDQGGKLLAYNSYLGSPLENHSMIKAMLESKKISDMGDFENRNQNPTVGSYERAKNSNAYVIVNQTVRSRTDAIRAAAESGVMGIGFIAIISFVVFLFGKKDSNRVRQLTAMARKGSTDQKDNGAKASSSSIEKERRELFEQLGLTFLTHLRGPIYSSLGKIHKLADQIKDAESKKDIEFLESEVRRLRDFVEGLGQTFDLDSRPSDRMDVSQVVEAVLGKYRKVLAKREINLDFEPHVNAWSQLSRDDLNFILKTIFDLAAHKLSYSGDQKKLSIKMERVAGMNRLSILMVGTKLSAQEAESLFLIRDRENLEMSFARGFALSWNGNLTAESSLLGARVFLELPAVEGPVQPETPARKEVEEKPTISFETDPQANLKAGLKPEPPQPNPTPIRASEIPEEPLETRVSKIQEDSLSSRRVTEELDRVLPPTPNQVSKTEVSVVEDLTATETANDGAEAGTGTATSLNFNPDEKDEPPKVKIRKPKVRFDV